ncbi:MAG: 3-oxoacyl-[acyl-carrier-protein] reductase [Candidatus Wallbacteria bacterium]|nr:3-oxoacyl-[acyl-carrier-protein] reductase [Candidatus Wallbacteria bacterium]
MKLDGKVAVITGSARGIGLEIARTFVEEGCSVLLSDVSGPSLEQACGALNASGKVAFVTADVTQATDAETMARTAVEKFGRLDILVNNAGITRDGLLMRMKDEDWDLVLNINLKGAFLCSKAVLKHVIRNQGSIINIASIVGMMGNAGQCNYSASKAGLIGFTKSLAREIARKGARVNAIAPGFIQTAMTDQLSAEVKEELLRNVPLGRLGQALEIAKTALFLASDDAAYITGQVLQVNGGMYM